MDVGLRIATYGVRGLQEPVSDFDALQGDRRLERESKVASKDEAKKTKKKAG